MLAAAPWHEAQDLPASPSALSHIASPWSTSRKAGLSKSSFCIAWVSGVAKRKPDFLPARSNCATGSLLKLPAVPSPGSGIIGFGPVAQAATIATSETADAVARLQKRPFI